MRHFAAHKARAPAARRPTRRAARAVQGQLGLSSESDRRELAALRERVSHRLDGARDALGMRKMVLVATPTGHLFALHSANGRVLWSCAAGGDGLLLRALRVLRVPHRVDDDPEVRGGAAASARGT